MSVQFESYVKLQAVLLIWVINPSILLAVFISN